jgi:8-oxo-dGTP diphosphatase
MRASGILKKDDSVLLVQLKSPVSNELVWMPPGGGIKFGEPMAQCLKREFAEETGLEVTMGPLLFVNEMVQPPFHAIECYFSVEKTGGQLHLGTDPELDEANQLLKDVQWISIDSLDEINVEPKQLKTRIQNITERNSPSFYSRS